MSNRTIGLVFSAALTLAAGGAIAAAPGAQPAPAGGGGGGAAAAPAAPRAPFTLSSTSFKFGDTIASKHADNRPNAQGANNCGAGENVAPQLAWANPPPNAKSFAILMTDPDGGNGVGSVHWVAYDIPANKLSLAEGEGSKTSFGGGTNGRSAMYNGPCPPAGPPHVYVFTVIATDYEPGTLKQGMTRDELIAALRMHTLGSSTIAVKYARPAP
jgi:Raf kinase inhibitor-like YbhB/YbcL family protein